MRIFGIRKKPRVQTSTPSVTKKSKPSEVTRPTQTKPKSVPKPIRMAPESEFLDAFKKLTRRHRPWDVWRDFITMFACALSNGVDNAHFTEREELYLKTIAKYSSEEAQMFPILSAYTVLALEENQEQDFLGRIFMQLGLGNSANGQFFTPYSVCQLMTSLALYDVVEKVDKDGILTIQDCACGAGATLIAGIHEARRQLEKAKYNYQNHLLVVAQDIDFTVAMMCYIQLSLLGVAGYVKVGNTLTEPMTHNDSTENYWFTPMYFSDVWVVRRMLRKDLL